MRAPRSWQALVVGLALGLSGCAAGADDPPTTDGDWGDALASLAVLEPGVDVADEPADVATATYRAGEDGEGLVVRDLVRTDDVGFAEVRWLEGALARLDVDTVLEVTELDLETGQPVVSTRLDVGRVWNRLDADAGVAEYEVATDVGTAAVRGTGFLVACVPLCTFGVAEGVVALATAVGVDVELRAGEQVTLDADGQPGSIEPFDLDDLWVQDNLSRDEGLGFPAVTDAPPDDDRPQLATARMDGVYQYDFVMEESSRDDLVGQEVQRNWGFAPDCDQGPCAGTYNLAQGEDERFVWTGTGYAATWVDRPTGACPDGSARWLEDFTITFVPTAFEDVDGQAVVTAADAVWVSTLTPTDEAVASGCDTSPPVDQRLVGSGTRTGA